MKVHKTSKSTFIAAAAATAFLSCISAGELSANTSQSGKTVRKTPTSKTSKSSKIISASTKKSKTEPTASKVVPTSGNNIQELSRRPVNENNFDPALLSTLIFDLTNEERAKKGLRRLSQSRSLAQAAVNHSADMAKRSYFSHSTRGLIFTKSTPRDRVTATGYRPRTIAENIAMIPTFSSQRITGARDAQGRFRHIIQSDDRSYETLAKIAMEEWMKSPGHRKNILDPAYREIGIGIALGKRDGVPFVYLTQDFAG